MKFITFTLFALFLFFSSYLFATVHVVSMVENEFVPANLSINVGDTVRWTNDGTMVHTTTSGVDCSADGLWDSGSMNPNDRYSVIFGSEGEFPYFCIPHCGVGMEGNISVSGTSPVDDRVLNANVDIYPNPVGETLNMTFEEAVSGEISISLYDLQGRELLAIQRKAIDGQSMSVDVSALESGTYFVRIYADGELVALRKLSKI